MSPTHLVHQLNISPHKPLQRRIPLLNHLRKRIRHQLRSVGTCVRVILRVKLVRRRIPKLLERLRRRRKVINVINATPRPLSNSLRIPNKPRRRITVHPSLPLIIRRLAAHNNLRALRDVRFRGVGDVLVERVHFLAGFAGGADFGAGAGAVAAAVVGGAVRGAAVVVAEFDHDDVVGFE